LPWSLGFDKDRGAIVKREPEPIVYSPGNERLVHHTINNLFRNGAERVFYSETEHVHVSGHANRDELKEVLLAVRPHFFVPVHGEYRQLLLHAQLAEEAGIPHNDIFVVEDGRTIELTADSADLGPESGAGFVFVDGLGIGDVEQVVLRDRMHLAQDGIMVITVTIDRDTGSMKPREMRSGPAMIAPVLRSTVRATITTPSWASRRRSRRTTSPASSMLSPSTYT